MKVGILAGGFGTRISEETNRVPKPMVEIGNKPILWHIMKIYSFYGFNDFVIMLGYKSHVIKDYFLNYCMNYSDINVDFKKNKVEILNSNIEPWNITLVDTGLHTMTGGRIKQIEKYVDGETFMLTYGDGVSDVNINKLLDFHKNNNKYATLTAVQPKARFGELTIESSGIISNFKEKPEENRNFINGGFFCLEPEIFDYIEDSQTIWERDPLEKLSKDNQLMAYKHEGFWKSMDMLKDKRELEKIWNSGNAPWKLWE